MQYANPNGGVDACMRRVPRQHLDENSDNWATYMLITREIDQCISHSATVTRANIGDQARFRVGDSSRDRLKDGDRVRGRGQV